MKYLKICLKFNVSEGSVSSIYSIPTNVFASLTYSEWDRIRLQGGGVKSSLTYPFLHRELQYIDLKLDTHVN